MCNPAIPNSWLAAVLAMQVLASIIRSSQVPIAAALAMEQNITSFEDCLGGCERILRTPIPLFYTRYTISFFGSYTCAAYALRVRAHSAHHDLANADMAMLCLALPRRHTSRFMMIWLTLLPFTLYDTCGWSTIPLCGTIAFLLLGERALQKPQNCGPQR